MPLFGQKLLGEIGPVIVIKRKRRRSKAIKDLLQETYQNLDILSYESERPKNPLEFVKTSYAKALMAVLLVEKVPLSPSHIRGLFGEPSRIIGNRIEWVVKIPSRQVLKILLDPHGVFIYGFNRTPAVNKWIERLLNT